jgi:tetratricopeptide (TPR) repeat protein/predicted Ser/Thr protein kinase
VTGSSVSTASPTYPSVNEAILAARTWPRPHWLDLVRRDQCERWRSGDKVPAEVYFNLLPELRATREDAIVLVCGEMHLRREVGDSFMFEEYQTRFADLRNDLALQFEIDRLILSSAEPDTGGDALVAKRKLRLPGYDVLREIGRGSSSVVYLARQVSVDRLVAIKAMSLSVADERWVNRQRREASILSRLQHSGIVQIYDAVEAEGLMCSVIEYVDGQTLAQQSNGMPLDSKAAARIVRTLAKTMEVVHEAGIVHRDLKPSNVLMASEQGPKITDFGLAKFLSADQVLTTDSCLLGTPSYMPPEQASGDSSLSGVRSDVYSLGAILYELLTGRPPFLGVTILDTLSMIRDREPVPPRTLQPKTPADLETICLKCLEKQPEKRYPTAAAMAGDLERFLNDFPITARRPSAPEKCFRWCRRNPIIATLAAGLLAAVFLGFGGILWQWDQAERARLSESVARREADSRAGEVQDGLEKLQAASAHLDRARVFWQWRRGDDAIDALAAAIALRPDLSAAWEQRGQLYADLGLWELAAADERRAFELSEPSQAAQWWSYAMLLAHVGDVQRYQGLCRRMQERFRGHHGSVLLEVVRTACVIPSAEEDFSREVHPSAEEDFSREVQRLRSAELELPRDPVTLYVMGLAQYRAGQFTEAVQSCTASQNSAGMEAQPLPNSPVLALAYEALGDLDNARVNMEMAKRTRIRWIDQLYAAGPEWITHRGASANWPLSPSRWLEYDTLYREAMSHMHAGQTTDNARLAVLRARAFAALDQHDDAEAEYQAALACLPRDDRIRMERHRNLAYRFVHGADFAGAAEEFAEATKLDPNDAGLWLLQAEAFLEAGNTSAYRNACAEMFELFANTREPWIADKLVWGCVAQTDSLPDFKRLAPLAEIATASYSGASRLAGAVWVRAGQFEEALAAFEDASNYHPPNPWDWSFRAIAHHHLGQSGAAHECVQQAAHWIDQADRRKMPDVEVTKPCWSNLSWYEHAGALRLFDEARLLITSQRPIECQ